jgi:hypothetical protein
VGAAGDRRKLQEATRSCVGLRWIVVDREGPGGAARGWERLRGAVRGRNVPLGSTRARGFKGTEGDAIRPGGL